VSDRAFTGRDVQEAVEQAAHALGLRVDRLRYVVLDVGSPGGRGLKPTPARIAVLLGAAPPRGAAAVEGADRESSRAAEAAPPRSYRPEDPGTSPGAEGPTPSAPAPSSVDSDARALIAALARTAGLDLSAEVEETAQAVRIQIVGSQAAEFLLGPAGAPVVFEALESLLYGQFGRRVAPRKLMVECEGLKAHREDGLRAMATELAQAVLADQQPRTTAPLNSYERRLVHVALQEHPGIITYSVGDGASRRVTIAPAEASLGGEVH
jgi:spoIIIJ-associated protein